LSSKYNQKDEFVCIFYSEKWNFVLSMQFKDDKLLRNIAIKLKELRRQRNITQEALYEDIGINISRLESGKYNLSISNLKKICDYFEISLSQFLSNIEVSDNDPI